MLNDKEDVEIFKGKSFSGLLKDIYDNSTQKHKKINELIDTLSPMIRTLDDATMVVPLIKEYFEIGVKNDDLLVKLAGIVQRHITVGSKTSTAIDDILTDAEKEQLLKAIQIEVEVQNEMR